MTCACHLSYYQRFASSKILNRYDFASELKVKGIHGTLNQCLQNALLKQQALSLDFVLPSDRYQSPYWRALAATRIQVAWRYRQKRLKHSKTTQSNHFAPHSNHSSFSRI
jgi:hypothetical protein